MSFKHFLFITSKSTFLTKFLAFILAIFAPLATVINILLLLLLLDAITSIYYQIKTKITGMSGFWLRLQTAFHVIESRKLKITLEKMFFYVLAITTFFLFDKYILHISPINIDDTFALSFTNFAATLICMTELTSIMSNLSKITNNPIFNRLTKLLRNKINKSKP